MQDLFEKLLISIGEDPNREGLLRTPERAAESIAYLTKGYTESLDEIINSALFASNMSEMVLVKNIELFSLCEHHLLPFFGRCHVGYIPNGRVIGLSKIARVVDHFARRLQIQEQLTQQIAETIYDKTDAIGVAVVIEAKHLCMMMRGVEKQNSQLKTSVMLGSMRDDPRTRAEFFSLIQCGE